MSPAVMLGLVLLAAFGLATLILALAVALAWRAGLQRTPATSAELLMLRLLPAAGGLVLVLTVVLPAFLSQEPHQSREAAGPLLMALAAWALLTLGLGGWRAWRACAAARALLRNCGPVGRSLMVNGRKVGVVAVADPIVAVVGAWRPQIVAAECVLSVCSADEVQQVMAHEAAHVRARDNLKQLLLIASPDMLGWTRAGAALLQRWRTAAELEADQRATGDDSRRRLALAAALIKVARALGAAERAHPALSMPVAADEVDARVRRLLAPPRSLPGRAGLLTALLASALLLPLAALPLYPTVHELIEALVRLGR